MDTQEQKNDDYQPRHNGRVLAGFFLLLVGAAFLLKEMDFPFFPHWLFTWPMILIVIGIYTGIKHEFRNPGWIIMIVVGGVFLADEADLGFDFHRFIVPIIILAAGFIMIVRPKGRWRNTGWHRDRFERRYNRRNWKYDRQPFPQDNPDPGQPDPGTGNAKKNYSTEDYIEATSVFSGIQKNIVSKNFKGGEVTNFMGGTDINLSQADINGIVVLEITQVMGGTKLIVPPHWQIRSEVTAVFAGYEDKRQQLGAISPDKILVLKGTSVFAGIEIKNY